METLQKLAVPIAIVIAGGMIAVSLFFVNSRPAAGAPQQGTVAKEIRSIQKDDHVLGNPNAKIVIVEYSDPECPFCKVFHETMHKVISEYGANGDVTWVYRHFPIPSLHPKAPKEAEALECAAEQGGNDAFWKFTDKVYESTNSNNSLDDGVYNTPATPPNGKDGKPYYTQKKPRSSADAGQLSDFAQALGLDVAKFEACLKSGRYAERVTKDTNEAVAAGGQGTPHSIMIVGGEQVPIEGAQPFETVKGLIDSML